MAWDLVKYSMIMDSQQGRSEWFGSQETCGSPRGAASLLQVCDQ